MNSTSNHRWRQGKNIFMQSLTFACAILVIAPLALIFFHLLKSGLGSVNWAFFTQLPKPVGESGGGMSNAIVGTFELLALAALIGVPIGVGGGIFLSDTDTPSSIGGCGSGRMCSTECLRSFGGWWCTRWWWCG